MFYKMSDDFVIVDRIKPARLMSDRIETMPASTITLVTLTPDEDEEDDDIVFGQQFIEDMQEVVGDTHYVAAVWAKDTDTTHYHALVYAKRFGYISKRVIAAQFGLDKKQVHVKPVTKTRESFGTVLKYVLLQGLGFTSDAEQMDEFESWPKSNSDMDAINAYAEEKAMELIPEDSNKGAKPSVVTNWLKCLEEGQRVTDIRTNHPMFSQYIRSRGLFRSIEEQYLKEHRKKVHMSVRVESVKVFDTKWQDETEAIGRLSLPKKKRHLYIWGDSNTGKTTFADHFNALGWACTRMDSRFTITMDSPDIVIFDDWEKIPFAIISKVAQGGFQFEESTFRQRVSIPNNAQIIILSNKPYTSVVSMKEEEREAFCNRFHRMRIRKPDLIMNYVTIDD